MHDPRFAPLAKVLIEAYEHAASGKGADRHDANGATIEDQPIVAFGRMLNSIDGHAYQVMKKAHEASLMARRGNAQGAIAEMLGVINYAAAAIIVMRQQNSDAIASE